MGGDMKQESDDGGIKQKRHQLITQNSSDVLSLLSVAGLLFINPSPIFFSHFIAHGFERR